MECSEDILTEHSRFLTGPQNFYFGCTVVSTVCTQWFKSQVRIYVSFRMHHRHQCILNKLYHCGEISALAHRKQSRIYKEFGQLRC